jgi:3'-5' exonuclease
MQASVLNRTHLIFDLETVPDYSLYVVPEAQAGTDRPIAPPYAHCPIAIGVLWLDQDYSFKRLGIVGEERATQDEATILSDFVSFIDRHRPRLVTYNGRTFDLPVVAMRALHHGLAMPWYYKGRDYRFRYSDEGHLDLCDFLSDHGASRYISLNAAARLIGLPGKMGVDGSQVETLYRSGQIQTIRHYCLTDVVQTTFLFLRFQLLQGSLALSRYKEVATGLLEALMADGRTVELLDLIDRPRLLLEGKGEGDSE